MFDIHICTYDVYIQIHLSICMFVCMDDYTYVYFYDQYSYMHNIFYICGLFGGYFNFSVWQIFIGLPNLNYFILNELIYFICILHGMTKFFIWLLH